jgi:hypothetical protein
MPHQCGNCRSLFFKTLETRIPPDGGAILYKKRCKRCKFKTLIRKELATGTVQDITHEAWLSAVKVSLPGSRLVERGRVHISEYSSRISRAAESHAGYLKKIEQAQDIYAADHSGLMRMNTHKPHDTGNHLS